jgi:uncharacterized protein YerC
MPHISKKKLDQKTVDELEKHLTSITQNAGSKTRIHIFEELLTKTETVMLAKRIGILFLLKKGVSLYKISEILQISPSTAERFRKDIEAGKYKHTTDWLWKNSKEGSFDAFMEVLVALAFTGRRRSFKKFIDEF